MENVKDEEETMIGDVEGNKSIMGGGGRRKRKTLRMRKGMTK
jgi:hypothetical protein